jgi:hypothetical protein
MIRRSFKKTLYNNVYSTRDKPNTNCSLQTNKQWALYGVSVYRYVFTTNLAAGAALLLCLSLLLQPLVFVYAEEIEPESVEVQEVLIPEQTAEAVSVVTDVSDNGDDEEDVVDEVVVTPTDSSEAETVQISMEDAVTVDVDGVYEEEQTEGVATSTQVAPVDDSASTSTATSSVATASNTNSGTTTTETVEEVEVIINDSTSDENTEAASSTVATTSTPVDSVAVSNVQTDNVFAFNRNECTEVEDGSFYCQKIAYDQVSENDLFAAPDATGDMEIYVVQNGERLKVTDNTVDDASPHYDAKSKSLVWHRLINDRYQIVAYDVASDEEVQLTETSVNNMEPTRSGDYTVWQRWVKDNWEIILLDGDDEIQLTDTREHDIAPHIRGDLIIWNVRSSDGTQSLKTYDITSGVFNEIADTDGVSVSNPRMLVMYEAQYQNGDTVIKGFDLVTGEIVPIERIPQELPTDIPSAEPTGEVRALPTNPQSEEEQSLETDIEGDDDKSNVNHNPEDLVLVDVASTTNATTTPQDITEFDLDLRPADSLVNTNDILIEQAAIPDVLIATFDPELVVTETASSTQ